MFFVFLERAWTQPPQARTVEEKTSGAEVASVENCVACTEIYLESTMEVVQVKVTRVHLTHKVKTHRDQTKAVNSVESCLQSQNTWFLRLLYHPLGVCHCSGYLAPPSHLVQPGQNDMPASEVRNHTCPFAQQRPALCYCPGIPSIL